MIYDKLEVIDGDTIKIRLWPSRLVETCRIEGLDTDEINTDRGKKHNTIANSLLSSNSYIFVFYVNTKLGRKRKRDAYGRLLVRVYVWRYWRYVNYAEWMKKKGHVKRGSKWNS